jgi:[CysO sulfur-carrier protein]-S-L-cysteine hydrolase
MTGPVPRLAEKLQLPDHLRELIIEHCVRALPDEGCGLFAVANGTVIGVYPTDNLERSPTAYTIPPRQHHAALLAAEAEGWHLGGTFHSHPAARAVPSRRDIEGALDPEWIHLIVEPGNEPIIRAWRIQGGRATEVAIG